MSDERVVTGRIATVGGQGAHDDDSLPNIIELIASEDEALINAIGHLDTKHFRNLVNRLETLRLQRGHLLDAEGEAFDLDQMLSPTPDGRTRLSVLSTKFLDPATIEFWVSRALVELSHWASRHPSPKLQAIVMFDEADIYMPAQRKPATKEPMQSLLERARSAGVGVFLCTQSPGDLDYRSRDNIRSWFLGRIGETTAINKMRPLLTEARTNIDSRLSRQGVGGSSCCAAVK